MSIPNKEILLQMCEDLKNRGFPAYGAVFEELVKKHVEDKERIKLLREDVAFYSPYYYLSERT